jgi:hypothetical protein
MVGLMQCDGIWIASGRFGVTWRLLQAQLKQPVRISGFCIQPESDDEDAEESGATEATPAVEEAAAADDGANEEDNAEPEVEEAPAPKKTKKTRKKAN